ncbi:phosphotransferase [Trueperella pyogenes]|uniref:phosphotransferase n=1 Tax=Trueperella pyogenes TaxID=1661 RepID=UPI003DAA117E
MGRERDFDELDINSAHELGRTLAAIHLLPHETIESAGLPSYDPQTTRRRLLSDLHDADATSPLPPVLRRRWENALELNELWEFEPRVVHGDIGSDQFLWSDGSVSCVLGFGSAHVGDPALDFSALVSALDEDLFGAVLTSYENAIGQPMDKKFFDRTVLLSGTGSRPLDAVRCSPWGRRDRRRGPRYDERPGRRSRSRSGPRDRPHLDSQPARPSRGGICRRGGLHHPRP